MAQSLDYLKQNYPIPAYNFRVTIDDATINFTEVSGITAEHQHLTYRHGLSFVEGQGITVYHYEKYSPVTLKRGTFKGSNVLYDWLKDNEREARRVDISLCDEQGVPVVTWRIAKAYAVKLESASFTAESNDVSIESLEIMASGISVVQH